MLKSVKSRTQAVRLKIEQLEDRLQPSVGFGLEDGLFVENLFDRDPLTGRPVDLTANASQLVRPSESTTGSSSVLVGGNQQVRIIQNNQPTVQGQSQVEAQQLVQATNSILTKVSNSRPTPVVGDAPPVQNVQAWIDQALTLTPVQLQVLRHEVNSDHGPVIQGDNYFTGFNGVAGDDVGYAAAVDDNGVAYYAGYTTGTNRDMMIWAVDLYGTFGQARKWQIIISGPGNIGNDEALGLAVDAAGTEVFVAGYTTSAGNGEDFTLARLNAATGALVNSVALAAPGDSRATDVRTYPFSNIFISATGYAPGTAPVTQVALVGLFQNDLTPAFLNGYTIGTGNNDNRGDAVALNYNGETFVAGTFINATSQPQAFFLKVDAGGAPVYAGAFGPGSRGTGVDIDLLGQPQFWMTGEFAVAGPPAHTRMLIANFLDNGTTVQQLWGFIWTYNFGNPPVLGNLAGNYVRADFDGSTYVACEIWAPGVNRATGDVDAHLFKVGPAGNTRPDVFFYDDEQAQAPANDKAYGLAFNGWSVVIAGKANSGHTAPNGFPVVPYAYQTLHADNNGTNSDAFGSWIYAPLT